MGSGPIVINEPGKLDHRVFCSAFERLARSALEMTARRNTGTSLPLLRRFVAAPSKTSLGCRAKHSSFRHPFDDGDRSWTEKVRAPALLREARGKARIGDETQHHPDKR